MPVTTPHDKFLQVVINFFTVLQGHRGRDHHFAAARLPAPHIVSLLQIRTPVEEVGLTQL